jgi:hypothetical protein
LSECGTAIRQIEFMLASRLAQASRGVARRTARAYGTGQAPKLFSHEKDSPTTVNDNEFGSTSFTEGASLLLRPDLCSFVVSSALLPSRVSRFDH